MDSKKTGRKVFAPLHLVQGGRTKCCTSSDYTSTCNTKSESVTKDVSRRKDFEGKDHSQYVWRPDLASKQVELAGNLSNKENPTESYPSSSRDI